MDARRVDLDQHDGEVMEKVNTKVREIQKTFGLGEDNVSLTYDQAAEVLGVTHMTVLKYASNGVLRRGHFQQTVHINDVSQRILGHSRPCNSLPKLIKPGRPFNVPVSGHSLNVPVSGNERVWLEAICVLRQKSASAIVSEAVRNYPLSPEDREAIERLVARINLSSLEVK